LSPRIALGQKARARNNFRFGLLPRGMCAAARAGRFFDASFCPVNQDTEGQKMTNYRKTVAAAVAPAALAAAVSITSPAAADTYNCNTRSGCKVYHSYRYVTRSESDATTARRAASAAVDAATAAAWGHYLHEQLDD
jgi:hypothetical protein